MTGKALRISIAVTVLALTTACGDDQAGDRPGGDSFGTESDSEGEVAGGTESGPDSEGTDSGMESDSEEGETEDDSSDTDEDPIEICSELTFDNPLDEALCPEVEGLGIEREPADAVELCRRLHIDTLGSSPTATDYEVWCKDKTVDEIVDAFMARPEYVQLSQRIWADIFHMNSELTYWRYLQDLDALVGQVYTAEDATRISIDDFAVQAVTHPGFLGRWDGLDLVGFNFISHFGRDSSGPERQEIFPLFRMWEERDFTDPMQGETKRVVLNTNNCESTALCSSDYWGQGDQVVVAPPSPGAVDPELNVIDVDAISAADWETLRLPGRRLAEAGEYYEGFVDHTIDRYLGYDLGTMVPPARQALVDELVAAGGNARAIERIILTSAVYTSTNLWEEEVKANPEEWDPPFWHGPVKQMDAEVWLRSAQKLVGQEVGSCDHRFPNVVGTHPHAYPLDDAMTGPDYSFRDTARLLGGCPDRSESFRETRAGLIAALTQATLTKDLCEQAVAGAPIYPQQFVEDDEDTSEEALSAAGNQIYAAAIVKPIPDIAQEALMAGVDGCRSTTTCGPEEFAFHTCRLVLKSADFLFY